MLGNATRSFLAPVYKHIKALGGTGESTIVYYGDKTNVENAAFVNASFGHGFEFDDVHAESLSHPASVVIPAALALGEREHGNGKDFILAVAIGHDVLARVGMSIARSTLDRGFHPMSVPGTFGSAAAAGIVLRFNEDKMVNAMGIAGSYSSGLTEYQQSAGEVKRTHAGIAAQGGLRAALLAALCLTGSSNSLLVSVCPQTHETLARRRSSEILAGRRIA